MSEDYGYTWTQVAHEKAIMNALGLYPEYEFDLLKFLELIEQFDFRFRYEKGDPKMKGIEARHEILTPLF